jgi:tripartite-type tricarboxylate transporter receptor subunit TctC
MCTMKLFAFLLGTLLGAGSAAAEAQTWPGTKPLKFEVIAAAGGLIDLVPRLLSNDLAAAIGVPVVVENRPGAGGNIAAGVVAKAEPDGHTLLLTGSNQAANPTLLPNPGFDYERDLAPVSMVVGSRLLLVTPASFPARTIADVIAMAKQKPKSVSIAITTIGTPNHLAAEMLAQYGDVELTFVPYESIAAAIPDLMAQRVNLAIGAISTFLPQVRSGALRALAVLSPQRSPFMPDIPTAEESGLSTLRVEGWICVMTTGGTPAPIIARLDDAIAKSLAAPDVRDALAKQGVDIFHLNPAELGAFLQSETKRFSNLLANSRVKRATQ